MSSIKSDNISPSREFFNGDLDAASRNIDQFITALDTETTNTSTKAIIVSNELIRPAINGMMSNETLSEVLHALEIDANTPMQEHTIYDNCVIPQFGGEITMSLESPESSVAGEVPMDLQTLESNVVEEEQPWNISDSTTSKSLLSTITTLQPIGAINARASSTEVSAAAAAANIPQNSTIGNKTLMAFDASAASSNYTGMRYLENKLPIPAASTTSPYQTTTENASLTAITTLQPISAINATASSTEAYSANISQNSTIGNITLMAFDALDVSSDYNKIEQQQNDALPPIGTEAAAALLPMSTVRSLENKSTTQKAAVPLKKRIRYSTKVLTLINGENGPVASSMYSSVRNLEMELPAPKAAPLKKRIRRTKKLATNNNVTEAPAASSQSEVQKPIIITQYFNAIGIKLIRNRVTEDMFDQFKTANDDLLNKFKIMPGKFEEVNHEIRVFNLMPGMKQKCSRPKLHSLKSVTQYFDTVGAKLVKSRITQDKFEQFKKTNNDLLEGFNIMSAEPEKETKRIHIELRY